MFRNTTQAVRVVTNFLHTLINGDFGMDLNCLAPWARRLRASVCRLIQSPPKSWTSEFPTDVLIAFLWLYPMWLCSLIMCALRGTMCALSGTWKGIGWSKLAGWGSLSKAIVRCTYQCIRGKDNSIDGQFPAYRKYVSGPVEKKTTKLFFLTLAQCLEMNNMGTFLWTFKNRESDYR